MVFWLAIYHIEQVKVVLTAVTDETDSREDRCKCIGED